MSVSNFRFRIAILLFPMIHIALAEVAFAGGPVNNLSKLHGPQITERLAGKTLTPDFTLRQLAGPFGERFGTGGAWQSSRQHRALLMLSGTWTVENDRLCVSISYASYGQYVTGRKQCREVWLDVQRDQIAMYDLDFFRAGESPILFFSRVIGSTLPASQKTRPRPQR